MDTLIIFIKNAQLGKVKTRLAATVGDKNALDIYQKLLQYTRKITLASTSNRILFYSDFIETNDEWHIDFYEKKVQEGKDLGERMKNAFKIALQQNKKAVIIGSDCIALTNEIIKNAFEALETHDFVIGPAEDGGYYLLGMNYFEPTVFDDIAWSTDEVLPKSIAKIADLQKKLAFMPTLSDIDNEEDWLKMKYLIEP